MNRYNPAFVLNPALTVEQAVTAIGRLTAQTKVVQSSLFELTSGKNTIQHHFEEINELVAQTETNLSQMAELSEWLDARKVGEVKS